MHIFALQNVLLLAKNNNNKTKTKTKTKKKTTKKKQKNGKSENINDYAIKSLIYPTALPTQV
jgi:hypothetical protein